MSVFCFVQLNEAKVNVQALRRDSAGSATSTTSSSTGGFGNHEPGPTLGQRISATQKLGHDIVSAVAWGIAFCLSM